MLALFRRLLWAYQEPPSLEEGEHILFEGRVVTIASVNGARVGNILLTDRRLVWYDPSVARPFKPKRGEISLATIESIDNGNRLTRDGDDYTYDAANQMQTVESVDYNYDENGNQTDRDPDTFEYDHEDRLTEAVTGSVTSTSEYNGDGLRMSLGVDDGTLVTTDFVWDVNSDLPVVLDDGTVQYVYGLGLISATDGSDEQTYYLTDGLGSTTDLTDDGGSVTDTYSYDVFGAVRNHVGSSTNPFQFTGQQTDADSGLQYLRARSYDLSTGRFLSQDPVSGVMGAPQSQNSYSYGLNNPVSYTDPSGMTASEGGFRSAPTTRCSDRACSRAYLDWVHDLLPLMRKYSACISFGITLVSYASMAIVGPMGPLYGTALVIAFEGGVDRDPANTVFAASSQVPKAAGEQVKGYLSYWRYKASFRGPSVFLNASRGGTSGFGQAALAAYTGYGCARSLGMDRWGFVPKWADDFARN